VLIPGDLVERRNGNTRACFGSLLQEPLDSSSEDGPRREPGFSVTVTTSQMSEESVRLPESLLTRSTDPGPNVGERRTAVP